MIDLVAQSPYVMTSQSVGISREILLSVQFLNSGFTASLVFTAKTVVGLGLGVGVWVGVGVEVVIVVGLDAAGSGVCVFCTATVAVPVGVSAALSFEPFLLSACLGANMLPSRFLRKSIILPNRLRDGVVVMDWLGNSTVGVVAVGAEDWSAPWAGGEVDSAS